MIKFYLALFLMILSEATSFDILIAGNKAKFFEIIIDRFEVVFETPEITESHFRVKKINKTRAIVGRIDIRTPIGNDFQNEYKILKKQGGEYRYLPYSIALSPVCDFLSSDVYIYKEVTKQTDFPEDIANNCPLVGNYSAFGITPNFKNFPSLAFPSGEYAGEGIFYKDGVATAKYRIYAYVNNV